MLSIGLTVQSIALYLLRGSVSEVESLDQEPAADNADAYYTEWVSDSSVFCVSAILALSFVSLYPICTHHAGKLGRVP